MITRATEFKTEPIKKIIYQIGPTGSRTRHLLIDRPPRDTKVVRKISNLLTLVNVIENLCPEVRRIIGNVDDVVTIPVTTFTVLKSKGVGKITDKWDLASPIDTSG